MSQGPSVPLSLLRVPNAHPHLLNRQGREHTTILQPELPTHARCVFQDAESGRELIHDSRSAFGVHITPE